MKKWIWSSILLFIVGVTIGNIFLMNKYEEKIYSVIAVSEFGKPKKGDIRTIISKDGVVTANREETISYNRELGLIDEIFVEAGDQVTIGTDLYQYETSNINRLREQLTRKIEIAEAERSKISKDLNALNSYNSSSTSETPEEKKAAEANEVIVNSQIRELELRDELLALDIEDYENQLNALDSEEESMVIQSTMDGIVKKISPSNPSEFMTILEFPYVVQGILSEKEIKDVAVGQKVFVTNEGLQLEGTVSEISTFPVETPSLEEKLSHFSFSVTVKKEAEKLPFGHHLGIDIVKEESLDTIYVPSSTVFRNGKNKGTLFIEKNGKLKKVTVKLGIEQGSKVETVNGLKGKELLVLNPNIKMKTGTPIILPLDDAKLHKKQLKEMSKKEITVIFGNALLGINE